MQETLIQWKGLGNRGCYLGILLSQAAGLYKRNYFECKFTAFALIIMKIGSHEGCQTRDHQCGGPKSRRTQFGETDVPPLPLEGGPPLSPAQDATISGYHVPVKSRVMMSEWAIGHNLSTWEDADEFKPSRFLTQGVPDFK
ncbi:hypothetical protein ACS0TY_029937 [Phlomoides rotata]